jgi:hypothetical protein
MKNYNTGVSRKAFASVLAAVVLTAGVFAVAIYLPGIGPGPDIPGPTSLGARTAEYLNSMRENVQHYFIANCSLVNEDITGFYQQSEPTAYVDGIRMNRTGTGGDIEVLFSPWDAHIVGTGSISTTEWNSFSGIIVDDGIGQMNESESTPGPDMWPPDLYFAIFFDDLTCFHVLFSGAEGLVIIQNGTWTGEFQNGWPVSASFGEEFYLDEDGHLATAMDTIYSTITSTVSYP